MVDHGALLSAMVDLCYMATMAAMAGQVGQVGKVGRQTLLYSSN